MSEQRDSVAATGGEDGFAEPGITIGELADRTGVTVRNIRAHQTRGLLHPPRVVGRTGYYDEDHVGRLKLILELQGEGFNLEAIRRIIASAGGDPGELLDFTRDLRAPYETEQPEILTEAEVAGPWGATRIGSEVLQRVQELGMMRLLGDGRLEVLSPKLFRAGVGMAELGIPVEVALDALEKLKERTTAVAELFIEVFIREIWEPFDRAGRPREEWPRVRQALQRMRPLVGDAFDASVQFAMEEVSERAISEAIRRELGSSAEPSGQVRGREGRREEETR